MQENKVEINKVNASQAKPKKSSKKSNLFEKISYFSLLISTFLLPLFFIPSKFVDFDSGKSLLIAFGVMISLIFWCVARIKDGKFESIQSYIFPSALLIVFIFFLSSIFSDNRTTSLIGRSFELGTFASVLIGFILMFLSASIIKTKKLAFYSYIALFVSFLIISIFQAVRLFFGADFLSFGYFTDVASNVIGKWNELGIYFGLIALLSVATLELASLSKTMKIILYFAFIVSIFFLVVVNFSVAWYVIGIFALLFVIYKVSFRRAESDEQSPAVGISFFKKAPYLALVIVIISAIFIVDGVRGKTANADGSRNKYLIGESIANYFKISQVEIRPSFPGTFDVFKSAVKENPVLGSGPNRFVNDWLLYKSDGINNTPFWNVNFNYGVGSIPTFIINTGILGLISWIIFLSLFIYIGFKYIFVKIEDKFSRYLIITSFLISLYLWIMNTIYATGIALFFMAFFFSGLFIATLVNEKLLSVKSFSYIGNSRRSIISVPGMIIIIICSITGGYIYYQKFFSSVYFSKSLDSANVNGNLGDGEKYAIKSLSYSKTDSQYRLLSDIYLARVSALLSQKDITAEALNKEFQPIFQGAVDNSKAAISYDDTNYQNYISLGHIYESVMSLGGGADKTAYDLAVKNYTEALRLNPKSPEINLMLARLEVINKNNAKAREYLAQSIKLKNDYTDAAFLLAQIEVSEGNIKNAIKLVETASTLLYNNPAVHFQLGILKYSDKEKDYKGAAEAFEKAVALNSSYSNARYFLGLSYYNLGRTADAINQFEIVQSFNPDNKEVALILKNLKEGRAPFVNAAPPVDDKPEKRKNLPIRETSSKEIKSKKK